MAFPVSPTNGQITEINGINYQFVSADSAWVRIPASANIVLGNITANNVTSNANVTAGRVYTNNGLFWAGNGVAFSGGITYTSDTVPPGSPSIGDQWYNTSNDILYEYLEDGTSSYWIDVQSPMLNTALMANHAGNLNIVGNLTVTSTITATGNITTIANINSSRSANILGNLTVGGNVSFDRNVAITSNLTVTSNISSGNITTANISATGNITTTRDIASTTISTANLSVTSNVTSGNITTGNLTVTGTIIGNIGGTGNVTSSNVSTGNLTITGTITGNVSASGNVTGANVSTGNLTITGNITGNVYASGNISGANVITSGNVTSANLVTGNIIATGNITTANLTFTGTITGGQISYMFERANVIAAAPPANADFDLLSTTIQYWTSNATTNFTANIRGNATTPLSSLLAIGQSSTVAMMVPQATAYYVSGVKIDNASITPIWQGASALSTGNANSIDVYTFTIIRTGTSTYKVFSSRTQYIHTG
jgi:cytoskeletal protein CcmA (bactofilin family)